MGGQADSKDYELPQLYDVYQLYKADDLDAFIEAADALLEWDVHLSRYDTIQLLILVANCLKDPRDTLDYFQRAKAKYRFWQIYHLDKDVAAISAIGTKLDMLETVVEKERIEWEEAQDRLKGRNAVVEESEDDLAKSDTIEEPVADDGSKDLAFRPKPPSSKQVS